MATARTKQDESTCPSCRQTFQCKAADIGGCQCYGFKLDEAAYRFISEKYEDCLCLQCLQQLHQQQIFFIEKPGSAS